jgi:antitoxin ParD1/3/4
MPSSYTLGEHFESFVKAQLASGRYENASEVLRDALRLMEERERRLSSLDAAIERGVADVKAGRVHAAEDVFSELRRAFGEDEHMRAVIDQTHATNRTSAPGAWRRLRVAPV